MDPSSTIAHLVTRLAGYKGKWPEVATASGVPISTVRKIAQGYRTNPRVETVDAIHRGLDALEALRLRARPAAIRASARS